MEPKRTAAFSRRSLLGALAAVPLTGCSASPTPDRPGAARVPAPTPTTTPKPTPTIIDRSTAFGALEHLFDARLGVMALDTETAEQICYQADERFAFCSTGKVFLTAAVLNNHSEAQLNAVIHYSEADLIAHSPLTAENLSSGMTLQQLCDAALRYSDNAAANLMYAEISGPEQLQKFMREIGDSVTNMDRIEPALNYALPGDLRDTTTPRAWGGDLQKLVLGNVLPTAERAVLVDWLLNNTTGATMIRTAVPSGWRVADKTGTGWHGTRNDIGVVWPPNRKPWVLTIMSSRAAEDAAINDELLAEAARVVVQAFT